MQAVPLLSHKVYDNCRINYHILTKGQIQRKISFPIVVSSLSS